MPFVLPHVTSVRWDHDRGYLMLNLPLTAWERFTIWLIIGLAIYFLYGRRHSNLAKPAA